MSAGAPVVGLFGTFDVEDPGDLLSPRVFDREMRRRLPHATVRAFSPFGPGHGVAMNDGWTPERLGLRLRRRRQPTARAWSICSRAPGST